MRRPVTHAVLVALGLLAAACSGSADAEDPATAAPTSAAPTTTFSSYPATNQACTLASQGDIPGAARAVLDAVPDSVLKTAGDAVNEAGSEAGRQLRAACPQYAEQIGDRAGDDAGAVFTERYRAKPWLMPTTTTTAALPTTTPAPTTTTTTAPPSTEPATRAWIAENYESLVFPSVERVQADLDAAAFSAVPGHASAASLGYSVMAIKVPQTDALGVKAKGVFEKCADAYTDLIGVKFGVTSVAETKAVGGAMGACKSDVWLLTN